MIDRVDPARLDELAERQGSPWVSIYLPTERLGPDQASKIRLKNLLAEAHTQLKARGFDAATTAAIGAHGQSVLDRRDLWAARERGLAVLISTDDAIVHRLAEPCEQSLVLSDSPELGPLRAAVERDRSFAVLALGLDDVRLLRGDRQGLVEDDPPVLPTKVSEVLAHIDREAQLQSHSSGRAGAGGVTASFHGQGASKDRTDTEQFLRAVDRALESAVEPDLPIVLAGVDRTVATFRRLSKHRGLVSDAVHGNVSRFTPSALHEKAWPIIAASS